MDNKQKTDSYFIASMLAIGLLGLVIFYHSRIISIVWEKVDRTEAQVEILMIDKAYQRASTDHHE